MPGAPLRVAVIGAGAFGLNHLRIYSDLVQAGLVKLVAIVDSAASDALRDLALQHNCAFYPSVEQLLQSRPDLHAASVCVPTIHHAQVAEQLLRAGVNALIEKPFASSLAEADALLQLARERNLILQVGHLERFNPAVMTVLPHLTRPMFFEVHRLSVFTPRSLDVDVVLDLMIHDLDIVLRMANSRVREIRAVGLPILSRHTDIANVRLEFDSGCVANFTASRVSTEKVRKLRLFQPGEYVSIDYARQDAFRIQVNASPEQEDPLAGLNFEKFAVTPGEPLRLEIEAFLHAVRTGEPSPVPACESRDALELALAVNAAMAEHAIKASLTS